MASNRYSRDHLIHQPVRTSSTLRHSGYLLYPFLLLWCSCQTIKSSPKYGFAEGFYYSRLYHKKNKLLYVVPGEDSIKIYSAKSLNRRVVDTSKALKIAFPQAAKPDSFTVYVFKKNSFDIDVLNLLFKFRPSVSGFPPQFNNNILNAAFYIGKRTDLFRLKYTRSPLGIDERSVTHYGFSTGLFTGFGAARIDEYVTQNRLSIQYDGVVNIVGLCAVAAMDKINFGINIGIDHLLDRNKNLWIYQRNPWIGLSLGLNIN